MIGFQWSYCDATTQSAELPDCECQDEWIPDNWEDECTCARRHLLTLVGWLIGWFAEHEYSFVREDV
jgi:hypothetical protein